MAPTGGSGSGPNLLGGAAVAWDPAVSEAGADTGYALAPELLRAPDVAIGNVPDAPGWVHGAPQLAIEYADVGQNEDQLARRIGDLLAAGTLQIWVVRLVDPGAPRPPQARALLGLRARNAAALIART